jgi:hypothetical protein
MKVEDPVQEAVAEHLLDLAIHCVEESDYGNQQIGAMLESVALELEYTAEKIGYRHVWRQVVDRRYKSSSTLDRLYTCSARRELERRREQQAEASIRGSNPMSEWTGGAPSQYFHVRFSRADGQGRGAA